MIIELDRYAIERTIKAYSNDLLSAFDSPMKADESTKRNAIARAQSLCNDFEYLQGVVDNLSEQIKRCQRRL